MDRSLTGNKRGGQVCERSRRTVGSTMPIYSPEETVKQERGKDQKKRKKGTEVNEKASQEFIGNRD